MLKYLRKEKNMAKHKENKEALLPSIRVTKSMREQLKDAAIENDVGLATIIRWAVHEWLNRPKE